MCEASDHLAQNGGSGSVHTYWGDPFGSLKGDLRGPLGYPFMFKREPQPENTLELLTDVNN